MKSLPLFFSLATLAVAACAPVEGGGSSPMTPPADGPSECKADAYRSYIGRNRSELPTKPAGETWRVTCTTCAVTMDFNPNRLNVVYDEASGIIREVKCG